MLDKGANSSTEKTALMDIFDSGQTEGVRTTVKSAPNCTNIELTLTEFEEGKNQNQNQEVRLQPNVQASLQMQTPMQIPSTGSTQGITDTEIRFGISAPFSGPARDLGTQIQRGIELAFRIANNAGGVNGRILKLIPADDGYEPTRTADAMKQLYDQDQVFGYIGNVGTPTAVVAVPFALEHHALFFAPFTGANVLRKDPPDHYVFNYRASYAEETSTIVNYLVKERHIKPEQIAVFAQEDSYGDAGFSGVEKAIRSLHVKNQKAILRVGYKRNTLNVEDAIAKLSAHKGTIKAIVMVASYRAAARFIEKTRDTYPDWIYTNVSFVGSTSLRDELMMLGQKYAKGVIVTQVVPPVEGYSSLSMSYKLALSKFYPHESPDYVSFEGYVAGQILIEGLRRTGRQVDTDKLVEVLENMHDLDLGTGTNISFTKSDHQGSHKIWATQLNENGKYDPIDLDDSKD